MKVGLRAQFKQTLENPNIEYYGNITIGNQGDLTLEQLWQMGFQAILVTVGAQGTKWLGLPGEQLQGVFHAKDVVYHYNKLPPFSEKAFNFGKRVAIIGVGNVMIDIARFLIQKLKVDEVATFARRGPMEIKFDRKQMEYIAPNLDWNAYIREINRVTDTMCAVGQDPELARTAMQEVRNKAEAAQSATRFWMRFLSSPTAILDNGHGAVGGLEIEDTTLVFGADGPRAVSLGTRKIFEMDSVIFAIGDQVDENMGIPVQNHLYSKNPQPRFPIDDTSFEICDPQTQAPVDGLFVAGWSRKASSGLVGIARKDGTNGAQALHQYLQTLPEAPCPGTERVQAALRAIQHAVVNKDALAKLEASERLRAKILGVEDFKYSTNQEMLAVMQVMENAS